MLSRFSDFKYLIIYNAFPLVNIYNPASHMRQWCDFMVLIGMFPTNYTFLSIKNVILFALNRKYSDLSLIIQHNMDFKYTARQYIYAPFTRQLMLDMLKDYKRPNDKINELVKSGELITLKKGLYIPGEKTDLPSPEPFLIANHLWGPSYISLESAMSYWGLIPERVYEITSITMKLSKKYKTPKGRFSYRSMASPYYCFGVKSIELAPGQVALIASPEKALCDKIITTAGLALRSPAQTLRFLLDDLRIDTQSLLKMNLKELRSWIGAAPKKESLKMLVKTLEKL